MSQLRAELWTYAVKREVPCLLCGGFYEQQYVAAVFFDGGHQLGDVCPRCLARRPGDLAPRLRERALQLRSQVKTWGMQCPLLRTRAKETPPQSAHVRAQVTELRRRAAQMRVRAEELLALGGRIKGLTKWPISLADVQEAERAAPGVRFLGVQEQDPARRRSDRDPLFVSG